tara:strand:+ start:121 stop:1575 length:1455 start_codon:yes stop_codon:yes gene_type:complete
MFKKSTFSLSFLIICLNIFSTEFLFMNDLNSKEDNSAIRLYLNNDKGDSIQIACFLDDVVGPYMWVDLNDKSKGITSWVYRVNGGPKASFKTSGQMVSNFAFVEDFLQNLETMETLSIRKDKSISEIKFANPKNKENLTKFFEAAKGLDSCQARTLADEAREIKEKAAAEAERKRMAAEAEAERKRVAAEKARKEAEAKERRAQQEKQRYADFKADLTEIFANNYVLELKTQQKYQSNRTDTLMDGICWGTTLYQVIRNEDKTDYVDWKEIKSDQTNYSPVPNKFNGLWGLVLEAQHTTNKESITFKALVDDKPHKDSWNSGRERKSGIYENNHCIELNQIRKSYGYSDLNTAKYKNVVSKIGELTDSSANSYWDRVSVLNIKEVASLFDKLEFEIAIVGFRVEPRFISIYDDFLKKWGESEFIEIHDKKSIQDFVVTFKNGDKYVNQTNLKIRFNLKNLSEADGLFSFDERFYDWSAWGLNFQ